MITVIPVLIDVRHLLIRLLSASALLISPLRASAGMVFEVRFDDELISGIDVFSDKKLFPAPPYIGSGTLSFDDDLADGAYLISSLTNLKFDVNIFGEPFNFDPSLEDGYDPSLTINISKQGTYFYFDGPRLPLGCGLSITNYDYSRLCFQSNESSEPPHNIYSIGITDMGSYSGIYGVPVPGPLPLLGMGAAFSASRKLRRRIPQSSAGLRR